MTAPTRECSCCCKVPDSYEIDEQGRCVACLDTKIESVTVCDGCDGATGHDVPLKPYLVTFHDGGSQEVFYCDDCAGLARMDWNGETASIVPVERKATDAAVTR